MVESILVFMVSMALGLLVLVAGYALFVPRKKYVPPRGEPREDRTFKLNSLKLQRPRRHLCPAHLSGLAKGEVATVVSFHACDACEKRS